MEEKKYSFELFGSPIFIRIHDTGSGINALICGGERPHIGAVSVKLPGEEVITHEFPSHREGIVSEKWSEVLCDHFCQCAVVSCGIHYDNITRDQISSILLELDKLLEEIVS